MPDIEILDSYRSMIDKDAQTPLHGQVKSLLSQLMDTTFAAGELFFKEMEVAERLGVSRPTVRQAMRSLEMEGRIKRSKGYGTIVLKRASAEGSLKSIAVILHTYQSESVNTLLDEIDSTCASSGVEIHVIRYPELEKAAAYLPLLRQQSDEGVILLTPDDSLARRLIRMGYRVVIREPDVRGESARWVETDNDAVVRLGLQHLTDLGHKAIALLVTEPEWRRTVADKIQAFRGICSTLGIDGHVVPNPDPKATESFAAGRATMAKAWKLAPKPSAVFAVSDFGALGAMSWCAQHNIAVPRDLSVLGFEGIRSGARVFPPLTSIGHDIPGIADALIRSLKAGDATNVSVNPILVLRSSTDKPRS
ncbi:MAG TPA: substrate-binding domain-containing protein [Capsulimonadaceae bacterium]|jgi:LacI family transcriptional regulator